MKFRAVLSLLAAVVVASFVSSYLSDEQKPAPRSPARIDAPYTQPNEMPGSGHAFGYGVIYTVAKHEPYNGTTHAVVVSNEPGVEIWTPIPKVLALTDGTKFHVVKASSFDEALKVISSRNR